ERIDRGEARAVLVVPSRFEEDIASSRPATVQMIIDGANANTASTVTAYTEAIVAGFSNEIALAAGRVRASTAAARPAVIAIEPRIWYNPQLSSTLFLVPGLIAFIAMITAVISTALSV